MKLLVIYVPKTTNRHKYVFQIIFKEIYQSNYIITEDFDEYKSANAVKINYSSNPIIDDEIFVEANGFLSKRDITEIELKIFKKNETKYLFRTDSEKSYLHDVFSSVFYLITRYEEYLPHFKDRYGRYLASESVASKNNFLQKPIVNIWVKKFIDFIIEKYPSLEISNPKFNFISTFDIDNAYLYKGKGFVRSIATLLRLFISFRFDDIRLAFLVVTNKRKDPFDTYSFQFNLHKKYNIDVRYFVLLGDYGLNDKNISYTNSNIRTLVKRLSDLAPVGIHPSFGSNKDLNILQKEISRLEDIQKREVFFSRQHFLQLSLPITYKNLFSQGIVNDYTMGYSSDLGFRAGIASPFTFYDLDLEQILPITIYPFALTDHILKFNMHLNPSEVITAVSELINEVKKVNGTLISVWHNDTFSDFGIWEGWKDVYEDIVKFVKK